MGRPLTVQAIEYLEPGKARREIPDGHTRGLWFVLQPSGAMSWAVRYRMNGKPRKLTLGPYPTLDLKAARHLARVALVKVANGNDPAVERQAGDALSFHHLPKGRSRCVYLSSVTFYHYGLSGGSRLQLEIYR